MINIEDIKKKFKVPIILLLNYKYNVTVDFQVCGTSIIFTI